MKKKQRKEFNKAKTIAYLVVGILVFALLQAIIVWKAILDTYVGREYATAENTETITFWADDVTFPVWLTNSTAKIRYDSREYSYDTQVQSRHEPDVKLHRDSELRDALLKEELTVVYKESTYIKLPWQETTYEVVEIRNDSTVFYTMEDYNAQQRYERRAGTIGIFFIEIVYAIAFAAYSFFMLPYAIDLFDIENAKRKAKKRAKMKAKTKAQQERANSSLDDK